jgi:hypothetical protein
MSGIRIHWYRESHGHSSRTNFITMTKIWDNLTQEVDIKYQTSTIGVNLHTLVFRHHPKLRA